MEDEEFKMIPTRGRSKIPRALSFAASPKTLSLAWQDVPQFDLMRLHFSCPSVANALRSTMRPSTFLSVYLGRPYQFLPEESNLEFVWDVYVDVCCCENAHEVREWLHNHGLALVRDWLFRNSSVQSKHKALYWRALFNKETREFHIDSKE